MDIIKLRTSIDQMLREVRTLKAYSTRVEEQLIELQGGVGTARKANRKLDARAEEIRKKVRAKFDI